MALKSDYGTEQSPRMIWMWKGNCIEYESELFKIEMAMFAKDGRIARRLYQEIHKNDPKASTPLYQTLSFLVYQDDAPKREYFSACILSLTEGGNTMNGQDIAKFGSPLQLLMTVRQCDVICDFVEGRHLSIIGRQEW